EGIHEARQSGRHVWVVLYVVRAKEPRCSIDVAIHENRRVEVSHHRLVASGQLFVSERRAKLNEKHNAHHGRQRNRALFHTPPLDDGSRREPRPSGSILGACAVRLKAQATSRVPSSRSGFGGDGIAFRPAPTTIQTASDSARQLASLRLLA